MAAWAFACLFLPIFPTGNAVAERGFSAMGAVHSKQRSEMGHEQVWAHMMIQFNGHFYWVNKLLGPLLSEYEYSGTHPLR